MAYFEEFTSKNNKLQKEAINFLNTKIIIIIIALYILSILKHVNIGHENC